jgi:predicted phage terminase large subunit-like protein
MPVSKSDRRALQRKLDAAKRLKALKDAEEDLIEFCRFMMPDPNDMDNPEASRYVRRPHLVLLASRLMAIEKSLDMPTGGLKRLAISMPPQHGKSETASRKFIPWLVGRNPTRNVMLGTYNQDFANDFGGQIRDQMTSDRFRMVFPGFELQKGSKAKDHMATAAGGMLSFLGRGGAGTGRPADIFVVDDPLKDAKEADSPTIRKDLREWFTKVAYTRCHARSAIVIIHTRWNEDDLIGWLCDPDHPEHDPEIAKEWTYINIPAIMEDDLVTDLLGLKPGQPLWPERFSLEHLETARRMNPRGFEALYQGKPAPDDGVYFTRDMIVEYDRDELPANLQMYGASDHALGVTNQGDDTVLGCIGVDDEDDIWVLPDVLMEQMETDRTVEEMLDQMRRHRPLMWFAENDVIKKAIGPFLRKRMLETKTYTMINSMTPSTDKRARARSIQGRMSMRKVRFPKFAPWWPVAKNQMLKFPHGARDDFVDFISWIGIGLEMQTGAPRIVAREKEGPAVGSIAWIKHRSDLEAKARTSRRAQGGF